MGQNYKLIGAPCAHRGPYTFYKAFKYTKNNITNILAINEFFFVKLWSNSDLISIGELRLLWEDKNCNQSLASLRLYILPENTPDGRISDIHGEDEVLAITEKVVIRLEDLLTWITEASDWSWGLGAVWRNDCTINNEISAACSNGTETLNGGRENENDVYELHGSNTLMDCSASDYSGVNKEKMQLDKMNWEVRVGVVVLSYARYCRYRGLMKRLEGVHNEWLRHRMIRALGGFTASCRTTKILFCKDTFDYPELEGHELLCNHLAPKLRSRIPKKKKSLYPSPDVTESDDSSSYSSDETDDRLSSSASSSISNYSRNSAPSRSTSAQKKSIQPFPLEGSVQSCAADELRKQKAFTQNIYAFMRARLTPIGKLPVIGNQEVNLYKVYNKVKHFGGYTVVTNNKLWKYVYEELGGEAGNAASAQAMKKYFERFLLPYEQHITQQYRPSAAVTKQSAGVVHHQPTSASSTGYDARRTMAGSSITSQPLISRLTTNGKPGDKENIPLKRALSAFSSAQVIDLRTQDESGSSRPQRPSSSSSPVVEVIDLCTDSPIKRSVPSISATLLPRKRKLDILRQGGLEVTPIASSYDDFPEPDIVTITKTVTGDSSSDSTDASVEILNPRKYTSASPYGYGNGASCNRRDGTLKSASQVLDLSTIKSNGRLTNDSIIKKISPSLGPNIEISIVPTDEIQNDTRKRKCAQMPVPPLRRISPAELPARNQTKETNRFRSQGPPPPPPSTHSRRSNDFPFHNLKPQISITSAQKTSSGRNASPVAIPDLSAYPPNLNQSLLLAAFYESLPQAMAGQLAQAATSDMYQHQLAMLSESFLQQLPKQDLDYQATIQRFANVLKNNSVSLADNCDKYSSN